MKVVFFSGATYRSMSGGRTVQLARALASRGCEVHLVELPGIRHIRCLPACRRTDEGIYVHSLPPCPGNAVTLWMFLVRRTLKRLTDGVWIVSNPFWAEVVKSFPEVDLVYDRQHGIEVFSSRPEAVSAVAVREEFLISRARLTLAVSAPLLDRVRGPGRPVLLPNGVSQAWLNLPLKPLPKRPVIGFYGSLHEWLDYDLLQAVARTFPEVEMVISGPARSLDLEDQIPEYPGIRRRPACKFDELPSLIGEFSVGIVPFATGEVARCSDPLKCYELPACGRSVLTTVAPGETGVPVTVAPRDHFCSVLGRMLRNPEDSETLRAGVAKFTWEARAEKLHRLLAEK